MNESFLVESVQVLDRAIVGHYPQIFGREHAGHDEVVLFVARVIGIRFAHFIAGELCALDAVVAVGDVQGGELRKGFDPRLRVLYSPDPLSDAEWTIEGINRLAADGILDKVGNTVRVPERQKDQPCLRSDSEHVAGAVGYLVGAGFLVLLDQIAVVLVDRAARDDAGLGVVAVLKLIDVDSGFAILEEHTAIEHRLQILPGTVEDSFAVGYSVRRELALGPRDAEKAEVVAPYHLANFLVVDDIVGDAGDVFGRITRGPYCSERSNYRHKILLISRTVAIDQFVDLALAVFNVFKHLIGVTLLIDLPFTVFADKRHFLPRTVRVLYLKRRLVAVDLFIALFDGSLVFADECFPLNYVVDGQALCLCFLLVHLNGCVRKEDLHCRVIFCL